MVGVRQFDEQVVLSQALNLFWQKGLRATSMLDLARVTGVQRNSLYNAYGNKEALFLLAFDGYTERLLQAMRKAFSNPDPGRAMRAFLEVGIVNMANGVPPRGCLTTKTATEPDVLNTEVQYRLQAFLNEMEAIATASLSSPHARERLILAPAMTAQIVVTFSRGLAVMERIHQDGVSLRRAAKALVRVLVRDEGQHVTAK
jgi:TetR/AcrR family transcriptional repressor of nem operon